MIRRLLEMLFRRNGGEDERARKEAQLRGLEHVVNVQAAEAHASRERIRGITVQSRLGSYRRVRL